MSKDMTTQLGWIRDLHFHTTRTPAAFAVACTLGLMAPSALATPEGGTFVTNPADGQILQFGPAGQTVTNVFLPGTIVDPSNRHIINWTSLDLGLQETLNFNGADGYSVMNRIGGLGTTTSINGTLNAMTGNVFIVNSAGVLFGQNAVINASGFHAAAASWSDGDALQMDFLAGAPLTFNTTGDVDFQGTLNASKGVALIGQHVRNTGDITGRYVVMAAGNRIVVDDLGSRFSVVIDGQVMDDLVNSPVAGTVTADLTTGDPAIHNSGTVTATDNVSLLVGDLLGLAILHDGEIHAPGGDVDLLAAGGAIWTSLDNVGIADAGLIDVSSSTTQAGTIDMSAAAIVLESSAMADGLGGEISIQGYSNVIMRNGAAVTTDGGIGSANAGTILLRATDGTVWADGGTGLSAKGGLFGGDGGHIEVDGQSMLMQAATKLSANSGQAGHLVINSSGSVTQDAVGAALPGVNENNLSESILDPGEMGRISVATGHTLSSVDGHLSVTSGGVIRFEASLLKLLETASFTSNENQMAIADPDQKVHATSLSFHGDMALESRINLSADSVLAMRGGDVSGQTTAAISISAGDQFIIEGDLGASDSKLASVEIVSGNTITLAGGSGRAGQYIHTAGDLFVGGLNDGGPVSATLTEGLTARAGGDITIDGIVANFAAHNSVDLEATGTLINQAHFDVAGSLRLAGGDVNNVANLSSTQGITMQAMTGELYTQGELNTVQDINLSAATMLTNDVSLTSEQGSIRLESYQSDVVSLASLQAKDSVQLRADNGSVLSKADVMANDVMMSAANGVVISGNVEATSSFEVTASAGDIKVTDGVVLKGDALSLTATAGSIDAESTFEGQTIDVTAANNLKITGDITALASALTAGDGNVTLRANGGPLAVTGDISGTNITLAAVGSVEYAGSAAAVNALLINGTSVTTSGDGALSGDTVALTASAGSIDAESNFTGTTVTFDSTKDISVAGDITSVDALALNAGLDISIDGQLVASTIKATSIQGTVSQSGSMSATGAITVSAEDGAVTLTGDLTGGSVLVTATGGDLTSSGNVMSTDTRVKFSSEGGKVTLSGNVAAATELEVLATNSGTIHVGADLTGSEVSLIADSVQLAGANVKSTSGNVLINGGIQVITETMKVSGQTSLVSADELVIRSETGVAQIYLENANLNLIAAGDMSLLSKIDGLNGASGAVTATAGRTLLVGGNIGDSEAVESLSLTGNELVLGGSRNGVEWDLSEVNALQDIELNTSNPTLSSGLPSIYGSGPSLSVRSSKGDITFGGNRGFSYLGDVVLEAEIGTLSIGDLTTLGDLTLRAETVQVYQRPSEPLLGPSGTTESLQTSVVAGGAMTIDGDVRFVGTSPTENSPLFGSVELGSGIPAANRAFVEAFDAADMTLPPQGAALPQPTLLSLAPIIPPSGDTIAAESHLGEVIMRSADGNEDIRTLEVLADLGIQLVDGPEVATATHHNTAAGEFVNDLDRRGSTMANPTSGLVEVTRSRLNDRFVRAAVADYSAALASATEAGSIESAGLAVREARLEWEAQPADKTDYRQWLAQGGDPIRQRAARILADFDGVYRNLRLAGLTRAEVAASRSFVSAKLAG
jgi:filamentous hemagglutinin family protein